MEMWALEYVKFCLTRPYYLTLSYSKVDNIFRNHDTVAPYSMAPLAGQGR